MKIRDIISVIDITKHVEIKCYDHTSKPKLTSLPAVPNHIIQDTEALKGSFFDRNNALPAEIWLSDVKQISASFDTVVISSTMNGGAYIE